MNLVNQISLTYLLTNPTIELITLRGLTGFDLGNLEKVCRAFKDYLSSERSNSIWKNRLKSEFGVIVTNLDFKACYIDQVKKKSFSLFKSLAKTSVVFANRCQILIDLVGSSCVKQFELLENYFFLKINESSLTLRIENAPIAMPSVSKVIIENRYRSELNGQLLITAYYQDGSKINWLTKPLNQLSLTEEYFNCFVSTPLIDFHQRIKILEQACIPIFDLTIQQSLSLQTGQDQPRIYLKNKKIEFPVWSQFETASIENIDSVTGIQPFLQMREKVVVEELEENAFKIQDYWNCKMEEWQIKDVENCYTAYRYV